MLTKKQYAGKTQEKTNFIFSFSLKRKAKKDINDYIIPTKKKKERISENIDKFLYS